MHEPFSFDLCPLIKSLCLRRKWKFCVTKVSVVLICSAFQHSNIPLHSTQKIWKIRMSFALIRILSFWSSSIPCTKSWSKYVTRDYCEYFDWRLILGRKFQWLLWDPIDLGSRNRLLIGRMKVGMLEWQLGWNAALQIFQTPKNRKKPGFSKGGMLECWNAERIRTTLTLEP